MKANESKEIEVKTINKVWKAIVIGSAAALAIGALKYNPGHLFTAGLVFAIGLESEIVKKDRDEIC